MLVELKRPADKEQRRMIADWFAETVNLGKQHDIPYMPNDGDDTYWTIDIGNDFKIKFFDQRPKEVEIRHRYFNKDATEGLALWFAYRWGGKVVQNYNKGE